MLALDPNAHVASAAKSNWLHLDANAVLGRLDVLKQNPDLVDQGALGLSAEAAFFHHLLQRDPSAFFAAGSALLQQGLCVIGTLLIDPAAELLTADYAQIVTDHGAALPPIPPQADWMMLCALRAAENDTLNYKGTPGASFAAAADFDALRSWYQRSQRYGAVTKDQDPDPGWVKANVVKTSGNHVTLWINAAMVEPGATGQHFISLETPLLIDVPNDSVTFDYWSRGHAAFDHASLTVAQFSGNYLGAIIANW